MRRGLLYAGTELGVFVSYDDGDDWQPLQLNLPISPVRDLVVKGDDLVVATHGRSFWILDDVTPLRQLDESGPRGGSAPVPAADGHPDPPEREHRHAAPARDAPRREPARRRHHRLLAEGGADRARDGRDPRPGRAPRAAPVERRAPGDARAAPGVSRLLAAPGAAGHRPRRPQPRRLGPAPPEAGRGVLVLHDRGGRGNRHPRAAARPAGRARRLPGKGDGGRPQPDRAAHGDDGPAGDGHGRRSGGPARSGAGDRRGDRAGPAGRSTRRAGSRRRLPSGRRTPPRRRSW